MTGFGSDVSVLLDAGHRPDDGKVSPRTIEEHYAVFHDLVARADGLRRAGRLDAAATYCAIAAKYAASQHTGLFASPALEGVLLAIGRTLSTPNGRVSRRPSPVTPRRVLHVITQATHIGGHTRMVWRWVEEDNARSHSVALTRQGFFPVPPSLVAAVRNSGGHLHVLDERPGGLLAWARRLRQVAGTADVVVLHVNPDDVVPTLAFADKTGMPPVVFLDHADQLFWVGIAVADVVAALRRSGAQLALQRRGLEPMRSALLPIALQPTQRTLSRQEAKATLGLEPNTTLLLSIARPHKFTPLNGLSLPSLTLPILQAHPEATLLAIGPDNTGDWHTANLATNGRVQALGLRADTNTFLQAADLYLDSFPIVSITSLLEAGSFATPLLSLRPHSQGSVLAADTPALERCLLSASSPAQYQAYLARLLQRPDLRHRLGQRTQRAIAQAHTGPAWRQALEQLYQQAANLPPNTTAPTQADSPACDEVDQLLMQLYRDEPDLDAITRFHLRLLPLDLRFREWLELLRSRKTAAPGLLLPEWLGTRVEEILSRNGRADRQQAGIGKVAARGNPIALGARERIQREVANR